MLLNKSRPNNIDLEMSLYRIFFFRVKSKVSDFETKNEDLYWLWANWISRRSCPKFIWADTHVIFKLITSSVNKYLIFYKRFQCLYHIIENNCIEIYISISPLNTFFYLVIWKHWEANFLFHLVWHKALVSVILQLSQK